MKPSTPQMTKYYYIAFCGPYPTHNFSSEQFINSLDAPLPREASEIRCLVKLIKIHLLARPVQRVHVVHDVVYHVGFRKQVVEQTQAERLACQCQLLAAAVFVLLPVVCYPVY